MRKCVTGSQMQVEERDTIDKVGVPALVLMERAAMAVVEVVEEHAACGSHIWIFCGVGNNGADGVAVARMLHQKHYQVTVVAVGNLDKATEEYRVQEQIAKKIGVDYRILEHGTEEQMQGQIQESDWIIDGIFGIGLSRVVEGMYRSLISTLSDSPCKNVIAIDIPSGVSADNGMVLGVALKASYTVTFEYEKAGLYLGDGPKYSGKIIVADIGLVHEASYVTRNPMWILEDEDCCRIPERGGNANKGTYGKLLLVAGSEGMSGAAYLSAYAAYKTGAGLVRILTPEMNRTILQMQLPEAIVEGYETKDQVSVDIEETKDQVSVDIEETKDQTGVDIEEIKEACEWATVIVMGPGLGQRPYVKSLVETVMAEAKTREIPLILDSDGLNTVAKYPELEAYYGTHVIVTPHMKEMSRLTGMSVSELKAGALTNAVSYSREKQVICVMKDAVTVVVDGSNQEACCVMPRTYLTVSGNSALAKGGTGDVLTGIIGGLVCVGMGNGEAAAFGSYLHGRAGARASEIRGKHGVLASELMDYLW